MEKVRKPTKKERIIRNVTTVVVFICITLALEGDNILPELLVLILFFTAIILAPIGFALGVRIAVYDLLYSEPYWLRCIRWIKKICSKK